MVVRFTTLVYLVYFGDVPWTGRETQRESFDRPKRRPRGMEIQKWKDFDVKFRCNIHTHTCISSLSLYIHIYIYIYIHTIIYIYPIYWMFIQIRPSAAGFSRGHVMHQHFSLPGDSSDVKRNQVVWPWGCGINP